jgi:protein HOOK3
MMMENHLSTINELKRKVEELTAQAEEASSLRDQLEEYRHAIEKMQRMENTLEKYKRKMEESSDLKRQIKVTIVSNTKKKKETRRIQFVFRHWKTKIRVYWNVAIKWKMSIVKYWHSRH